MQNQPSSLAQHIQFALAIIGAMTLGSLLVYSLYKAISAASVKRGRFRWRVPPENALYLDLSHFQFLEDSDDQDDLQPTDKSRLH